MSLSLGLEWLKRTGLHSADCQNVDPLGRHSTPTFSTSRLIQWWDNWTPTGRFSGRPRVSSTNSSPIRRSSTLQYAISNHLWWTLTRWRQVWCVCSVKTVWSIPIPTYTKSIFLCSFYLCEHFVLRLYCTYLLTYLPSVFSFFQLTSVYLVYFACIRWCNLSTDCFHYRKARFPLPELTARVNGPSWRVMETGHPSTLAVNSGRQLG